MKKEYDFSNAERGKFYRPNARLNIPVYLGEDVQRYATEKARDQGIAVEQFVNEVLRKQALADGFSGG